MSETCGLCGRTFKNAQGLNLHGTRTHGLPWAHGVSGYTNHRCRCDECRDAWRTYMAGLRLIRIERPIPDWVKHGRASTYRNYSCRCGDCVAAARATGQADRLRRKGQTA
jgi:hypothetical protein